MGQAAQVAVDGFSSTTKGTVSQVGPVQSSTSGYTYPVVVALPTSVQGLFSGSSASVTIATGLVSDVIAVPTSAVITTGAISYVDVLKAGVLSRQVIKTGMVGSVYTQVLTGLHVGQSVVLADLAIPVPSSNTSTLGGFGGGFGGGAGGFGGGGGAFRVKSLSSGGGGGTATFSPAGG